MLNRVHHQLNDQSTFGILFFYVCKRKFFIEFLIGFKVNEIWVCRM